MRPILLVPVLLAGCNRSHRLLFDDRGHIPRAPDFAAEAGEASWTLVGGGELRGFLDENAFDLQRHVGVAFGFDAPHAVLWLAYDTCGNANDLDVEVVAFEGGALVLEGGLYRSACEYESVGQAWFWEVSPEVERLDTSNPWRVVTGSTDTGG